MAAINSREAKPKRNAWQKGASMYVEKRPFGAEAIFQFYGNAAKKCEEKTAYG
jgi:hypothetical protein